MNQIVNLLSGLCLGTANKTEMSPVPENISQRKFLYKTNSAEISVSEDDKYVIKVFFAEKKNLFQRESQTYDLINRLQCQNIGKCCMVSPEDRTIVMENFGLDMLEHLNNDNVSYFVLTTFAMDMVKAIDCLHEHKLCHYDIKPENVAFSDQTMRCTLIDMGFVGNNTRSMYVFYGTVPYLPPFHGNEEMRNFAMRKFTHTQFNQLCDYYAFCLTFFEIAGLYLEDCCYKCSLWENPCDCHRYRSNMSGYVRIDLSLLRKIANSETPTEAIQNFRLRQDTTTCLPDQAGMMIIVCAKIMLSVMKPNSSRWLIWNRPKAKASFGGFDPDHACEWMCPFFLWKNVLPEAIEAMSDPNYTS